jgi:hypothetical protein
MKIHRTRTNLHYRQPPTLEAVPRKTWSARTKK